MYHRSSCSDESTLINPSMNMDNIMDHILMIPATGPCGGDRVREQTKSIRDIRVIVGTCFCEVVSFNLTYDFTFIYHTMK